MLVLADPILTGILWTESLSLFFLFFCEVFFKAWLLSKEGKSCIRLTFLFLSHKMHIVGVFGFMIEITTINFLCK